MDPERPAIIPPEPPQRNPLEKLKRASERILPAAAKVFSLFEPLARPLGKKLEKVWEVLESRLPAGPRQIIQKHRKKIRIGIGALILLLGIRGCYAAQQKARRPALATMISQAQKTEEGPVPVKGFKAGRFNFEDSLNALGTIKGAMEFKLSFEVPGVISSINYRPGERYEEGALLISLRQDDILLRLKRAQADFNKHQTQVQIAEKKLAEHDKLFAMGAIPKTTLENVKLELESSKFEAEAARLEVKANEAMLEKSNLYAPSAGMIGDLSIEEGEAVTPNTLLGSHIMTEYVYAEFGIVERDVNKIALGQKARVFVDAFPDKTFEGVIENIAPVVAGTSRTATARVRIENPDRLLLPGMFTRIRILLYSKKNTLVLPTDAIQGKEGEKFVYAVHLDQKPEGPQGPAAVVGAEDVKSKKKSRSKKETPAKETPEIKGPELGTAEKRAITVGYTRPDYSQIDAGISEGEVVAVSGLEKLENGKKIRLLETQEAEI